MWSEVETEAYSALCSDAQTLDEDACRELAEWFGRCFPRDALLVVAPQLPALLDLLGLRRYESVFTYVFTSLMQGVRDWSERSKVNAVLLLEGATEGSKDYVKPLKLLVVIPRRPPGCDRQSFFPDRQGAFAVDFEPDPDCQESMENAVRACRTLFAPLKMLSLLLSYYCTLPIWKPFLPVTVGAVVGMHIWQGATAAVLTGLASLFCLFCLPVGLSCWWWRLLGRASVYFKVEGVVAGQRVLDRSMGLAAAIAVLLALREADPSLRLLLPVAHFAKHLNKERADWGFSGEIEKDGMVRAVGGVSLKQEAFSKAGIHRAVFPRENQPPRTGNREKPGRPAESQAGALADRQPAPLYALGELRPYWVPSLGSLIRRTFLGGWGWGWGRAILNILIITTEVFFFQLPQQHASIVDVFVGGVRAIPLSEGGFRVANWSANPEFRVYIYANRYEPVLQLRLTLGNDLEGACNPDNDPLPNQCGIQILKGGETRFQVLFKKIGTRPHITVEVLEKAGELLCITHLFLYNPLEELPAE